MEEYLKFERKHLSLSLSLSEELNHYFLRSNNLIHPVFRDGFFCAAKKANKKEGVMKKILFVGGLAFIFMVSGMSIASAEGKGRNVGRNKFKIETGYEWDARDLALDSGKSSTGGKFSKTDIEGRNWQYDNTLKRDMFWVKGTYGITDFLDVFTKLGTVRSRHKSDEKRGTDDSTLNTNYDFAWGTGLRVNIYEWPNKIYINSGFEYLRGKHEDKIFYNSARDRYSVDMEWEEWIGRVESGWRIKRFTPYLGVQYSDCEMKWDMENESYWEYNEYAPKENWGGFYGLDVQLPRDFQINYESHLGDKESYLLSVGYKF